MLIGLGDEAFSEPLTMARGCLSAALAERVSARCHRSDFGEYADDRLAMLKNMMPLARAGVVREETVPGQRALRTIAAG